MLFKKIFIPLNFTGFRTGGNGTGNFRFSGNSVVADLLDCPKNCQLVCPSFS